MSVRCKMIVTNKADSWDSYGKKQGSSTVRLSPVSGDENKTWSKWTPSGSVELQINNEAAFEQFKLGQTFFVDFTPAPATEAEEK